MNTQEYITTWHSFPRQKRHKLCLSSEGSFEPQTAKSWHPIRYLPQGEGAREEWVKKGRKRGKAKSIFFQTSRKKRRKGGLEKLKRKNQERTVKLKEHQGVEEMRWGWHSCQKRTEHGDVFSSAPGMRSHCLLPRAQEKSMPKTSMLALQLSEFGFLRRCKTPVWDCTEAAKKIFLVLLESLAFLQSYWNNSAGE